MEAHFLVLQKFALLLFAIYAQASWLEAVVVAQSDQYTIVWRGVISQAELAYVKHRLDIIMKNCDIFKQFRQNFI